MQAMARPSVARERVSEGGAQGTTKVPYRGDRETCPREKDQLSDRNDGTRTGAPGGVALLDWLHGAVGGADARAAPVLARLFRAAWRPFGEQLEAWLFTAAPLAPSAPFVAPAPTQLRGWLPADDGDEDASGGAWVRSSCIPLLCTTSIPQAGVRHACFQAECGVRGADPALL